MGLDVGCDAAPRVADPDRLSVQDLNIVHYLDTSTSISKGEASQANNILI
jgi:hypothetical protein